MLKTVHIKGNHMEEPIFSNDDLFKEWSEKFLIELQNTRGGLAQIRDSAKALKISVRRIKTISAIWGAIAGLVIVSIFAIMTIVERKIEEKRVFHQIEYHPLSK